MANASPQWPPERVTFSASNTEFRTPSERLPQVLAGLHFVAFAMLMAPKVAAFLALGEPAISQ
jgi:hypothetical protein